MQNNEKMLALESIIYEFAKGQFVNNEVPPAEAHIIMKNVFSEFQSMCIESIVMSRIQMSNPEQDKEDLEKELKQK